MTSQSSNFNAVFNEQNERIEVRNEIIPMDEIKNKEEEKNKIIIIIIMMMITHCHQNALT